MTKQMRSKQEKDTKLKSDKSEGEKVPRKAIERRPSCSAWILWNGREEDGERGVRREQTRGSSCGRSVVAAAEPSTSACPIDFSSTTNWTIFHTVLLRPHLPFYLFPHSAELPAPHVSSLGNHQHTLTHTVWYIRMYNT